MSRLAYVNGHYVPHKRACIHIEDRASQFADAVYEVIEIHRRAFIALDLHLDRLERSLAALSIPLKLSRQALIVILKEVARRNALHDGLIYLQMSRGIAPREHAFPRNIVPSLIITAKAVNSFVAEERAEKGVAVITVPDNRWDRVDIKTTGLLPNVLAKEEARRSGAFEALFVDVKGNITEGASSNAWIVSREGHLITRPALHGILKGITRDVVLEIARRKGMTVEERTFSVGEAKMAREVFITAASSLVMPVVRIDETVIGNGQPGSIALRLRQDFHTHATHTFID